MLSSGATLICRAQDTRAPQVMRGTKCVRYARAHPTNIFERRVVCDMERSHSQALDCLPAYRCHCCAADTSCWLLR